MNTFTVVDDGTDRQRWLEARRATPTTVSATDAARIVTGGPSAWALLRQEKATGKSNFSGNGYTKHGSEREATIAEFARMQFGLTPSTALLARNDDDSTPTEDLATPDALGELTIPEDGRPFGNLRTGMPYEVDAFGEFKTTKHDWPSVDDIPKRYWWQIVWQFNVTGAKRCYFVFEPHENFVPLYMEPRYFIIERADVEADIQHAIESVDQWRAGEHEEVPESLLPLDDLLSQYRQAKEDVDEAAARLEQLDGQVRSLLTEHGKAVRFFGSDADLNWSGKPGTSTRFDSKAFREAEPAIYKKFTKTGTTQPRLTIKPRS